MSLVELQCMIVALHGRTHLPFDVLLQISKNDKSLACNYHPVSLTYVTCNMFELNIECSNIMTHLN